MKVVDIERCYTCKKEKESDEHRCCSKCCGYLRDYAYRIRERMNEQRKLNHQKKTKSKTEHTGRNISKIIVIK